VKEKNYYILASQSPRRRELLKKIIDKFDVWISSIDEDSIIADNPAELSIKLANLKMDEVLKTNKDLLEKIANENFREIIIITADTIVSLSNKIYSKPKDREEAYKMIKELSGKIHDVITGYCVYAVKSNKRICEYEISQVKIKALSDSAIRDYAEHSDCLDKAGAYAIQDMLRYSEKINKNKFFNIVENYSGSFSNIVGLPLEKLEKTLKNLI